MCVYTLAIYTINEYILDSEIYGTYINNISDIKLNNFDYIELSPNIEIPINWLENSQNEELYYMSFTQNYNYFPKINESTLNSESLFGDILSFTLSPNIITNNDDCQETLIITIYHESINLNLVPQCMIYNPV